MRRVTQMLPRLWTNWVTLSGTILTTVSGCILALTLAISFFGESQNPYAGALVFLVFPGLFVFGLILIPLGLWWEGRRKVKPDGAWAILQSAFDTALKDKKVRRGMLLVGIATLVNIVVFGASGQKAIQYVDSVEFCGTFCHTVMQPEHVAYQRSPHQRVACVDCHIGPGASWAAKAKISGLRQVLAVATGSFSHPIPTPVEELRPARDTCEQCHWPAKFHGNRIRFFTHYADDETNTASTTAMLMKVGGVDPTTGDYRGIHWHVSPEVQIQYEVLDRSREKIGDVTVRQDGKVKQTYTPPHEKAEVLEVRTMDCVDCHNRPTHIYDQTPARAVDRGFFVGRLDAKIPFLHEAAVAVITDDTQPRMQEEHFIAGLASYYDKEHPEDKPGQEQLNSAGRVLADLYSVNIFPEMGVKWGTYPSHLGHRGGDADQRGCFRCHNDEHKSEDGEVISQDCDVCHEILHEDEPPSSLPESLRALWQVD